MPLYNKEWPVLAAHNDPDLSGVFSSLKKYGFPVYQCSSASGIFTVLRKSRISILFIDSGLREGDPIDVIKQVKCREASIHVIMMAEFGDFDLAARAVATGVDTFIQIPFTTVTLLKRIQWIQNAYPGSRTMNDGESNFRDSMNTLIKHNMEKTLSQPEVSNMLGMSRTTLHRKIRKTFGLSFQEYIDRAKLEKAKCMLENRDLRICEIARALGFNDNNYYSRWFRQRMKMSPSEYRRVTTPRADVVRLGALAPLTGIYGDQGPGLLRGINLGAEAAFFKFGLDVDVYALDTATNPRVASRRAWEASIHRDIHYFAGCASSAVLQDTMQAVSKSKSLLITGAGVHTSEEDKLGVVFRWALPTREAVKKTLGLYTKTTGECRGIFTITADYIFGCTLLQDLKKVLSFIGIEHRGNVFHPLGCSDFGAYFHDALKSGADTIVLLNFGSDTARAIDCAHRNGINKEFNIITVWSNALELIDKLGIEKSENVYFGTQYWHDINLPANNDFIDTWQRNFGVAPSYVDAYGFVIVNLYLMAMKEIGGTQRVDAVKEAIEHLVWEGLTAPREYMHPYTHEARKGYYLLVVDSNTHKVKPL